VIVIMKVTSTFGHDADYLIRQRWGEIRVIA
jgi:hypothetical protein